MKELQNIVNLMPGYVSVVDLEGKYLAVNDNLKRLLNLDNFVGMIAGQHCQSQIDRINSLIRSSVGTVVDWEFNYQDSCLAVSSIRDEYYIISQAVDITSQKSLQHDLKLSEERNNILLKSLPSAIDDYSDRRSYTVLQDLILHLTQKPLVNQNDMVESLITLEIQLRQNSSRISKLEEIVYLSENSIKNKINQLELQQEIQDSNWLAFNNKKSQFKQLFQLVELFSSIPGGVKTWAVIIISFQILITYFVQNIIIDSSFKDFIEYINK